MVPTGGLFFLRIRLRPDSALRGLVHSLLDSSPHHGGEHVDVVVTVFRFRTTVDLVCLLHRHGKQVSAVWADCQMISDLPAEMVEAFIASPVAHGEGDDIRHHRFCRTLFLTRGDRAFYPATPPATTAFHSVSFVPLGGALGFQKGTRSNLQNLSSTFENSAG